MERLIIDTNALYQLLEFNGITLDNVKVFTKNEIKYACLKSFFETKLKKKELYIAPASIFEVTNKFRNNKTILLKVIESLEKFRRKYNYDLLCENIGKDVFSLENYVSKLIHEDYKKIINYEHSLLNKKVSSESEILYVFPLQIAIYYLLATHSDEIKYEQTYESYKSFINQNIEFISSELKKYIKKWLRQNFKENKPKHSFRKIYEDVITECDKFILYPFDYFHEKISNKEIFSLDINEILENYNRTNPEIRNNYKNWLKTFPDAEKINKIVDTTIENVLATKSYSVSQYIYFENATKSFFSQGTKKDTNDAIDFWLLGYIKNNTKLFTFDDEMIKAIKDGDSDNLKLINQFLIS